MIVLGIDTSGYANAVGVTDGNKVLADFVFEARTDSLEKIVANIDSTLRTAGFSLSDMEGIGVGLGPGSWTGIRVGVTVGKMLAFSAAKPVCGIPTLEALAYTARGASSLICSVISVGTGDSVYAGLYRACGDNIVREGDYYVGDLTGLAKLIKEPVTLVGMEAGSYSNQLRKVINTPGISIKAIVAVPHGSSVALLAAGRLEKGDSDDALALSPLYLKESTARAFLNRNLVTEKENK
jgi:tRNA threonylcarbamoyladenosine biosynthesis protein TsaB